MATPYTATASHKRLPKQIKILVVLIISVLLIGIIGHIALYKESPTGAFSSTVKTLAHISKAGANNDVEEHEVFQIIMQLFGVIVVWFSIWAAFDLAVAGKFEDYFKEARHMNQISKLRNHFIICGAGRVGKNVGIRLKQRGEKLVFIEKDQDSINRLRSEGYLVMDTGPIDEQVLRTVGIEHAKGIVATLGDDSKNLLLVLTAKELNPALTIAVRVNDPKLIPKFKRAGAHFLILPEAVGGVRLADAILGDITDDVMLGEQ